MNADQLAKMTPEEKRIAIAKLCGFTKVEWYEDNAGPPILHGFRPPSIGVGVNCEWIAVVPEHSEKIPDYLNNLDAMAEALAEVVGLAHHFPDAEVPMSIAIAWDKCRRALLAAGYTETTTGPE